MIASLVDWKCRYCSAASLTTPGTGICAIYLHFSSCLTADGSTTQDVGGEFAARCLGICHGLNRLYCLMALLNRAEHGRKCGRGLLVGPPAASVSTGGDWRIPKQTPLPVDSHPPSSHSPVPQTPTLGAKDSAAAPDGAPWPAWADGEWQVSQGPR
jgi:hypothetical protein